MIILNRPKIKAELSTELSREFYLVIDEIKNDDKVGIVIITGDENALAGNADLTDVNLDINIDSN